MHDHAGSDGIMRENIFKINAFDRLAVIVHTYTQIKKIIYIVKYCITM